MLLQNSQLYLIHKSQNMLEVTGNEEESFSPALSLRTALTEPFLAAVHWSRLRSASRFAVSGGEASEALVPGAQGPSPYSAASPSSCQPLGRYVLVLRDAILCPGGQQLPKDALQDCQPKFILCPLGPAALNPPFPGPSPQRLSSLLGSTVLNPTWVPDKSYRGTLPFRGFLSVSQPHDFLLPIALGGSRPATRSPSKPGPAPRLYPHETLS